MYTQRPDAASVYESLKKRKAVYQEKKGNMPLSIKEIKEQLYEKRADRDMLDFKIEELKKNMVTTETEDPEKVELINELMRLERGILLKSEEAKNWDSIEDIKESVYVLEAQYRNEVEYLKRDEENNLKKEVKQLKELNALSEEMSKLGKEIKHLKKENEAQKTIMMGTTAEDKRSELDQLFKVITEKLYGEQVLPIMQDWQNEVVENLEEMIMLLEELADEHFRPKEIVRMEKEQKEKHEAVNRMLADLLLEAEKKKERRQNKVEVQISSI